VGNMPYVAHVGSDMTTIIKRIIQLVLSWLKRKL
jgi:hypothetical protein